MKNITQPVSSSAGMIFILNGIADIGTNNIKGFASIGIGLIFILFIKDKKDTKDATPD